MSFGCFCAAIAKRLVLAVALALAASVAVPAAADERPNVLVLLADDLRWDCLGVAGHPVLRTPHIDRLAVDGIMFRNAFVTTSICCVSRASFITGRYARHHGVGDFGHALPPDVLAATYPAILKRLGYRTGCLGKWGLGGELPRAIFDAWNAWSEQGGFFLSVDGKTIHNSQYLADRAVEFLRAGPSGQPFCLLVYYKAPHDPYLPDPRDADLFRQAIIPVPPTYSEADFARRPEFIRRSEGRRRLEQGHPTPAAYQEFLKQYLRCVAGIDRSVGQILEALDNLKLADKTICVFSSDNGFLLGEHGLSGKWLMYEESIRVPLLIRDPRLPAACRGKRVDELVLNIDLHPTLLDLAGAEIPPGTDGRSLRPLMVGSPIDWRTDFFYEHHFDFGGAIPRTEGVRTTDWKYITYFDVDPAYEELYDLDRDPREEHNLAAEPAFASRLAELRELYSERRATFPPPVLPRRP